MGKGVEGHDYGHILGCCSGICVELLKIPCRVIGVLANKIQTEYHRIQVRNVTA